jgi:hypothetical protein
MKKAIVMLLLAGFTLNTYASPVFQQDTVKKKKMKEKTENGKKKWKEKKDSKDTLKRDTVVKPK